MSTEAMERDELLVEELLALEPEKIELAILDEKKYRTFGVGTGLARRAAALQGVEARRCAALAGAASACLTILPLVPGQRAEGERIRALAINAHRLLGEPGRFFLVMAYLDILLPQGGTGDYLRSLALVHWEQARTPEAVALLGRAERLFRAEGRPGEAIVTRRLRMLLHAERGEEGEALRLYASSGPADAGGPPWLNARAALTAAFCHAAGPTAEDRAAARTALAEGHGLASQVREATETLYLLWLAARAAARLTDRPADETLADLQKHFLASFPWIDVIPLTLDLFACRTPAGQGLDLDAVEADLRRTAPSPEDLSYAEHALCLTRCQAPGLAPWETAGVAGHIARNLFRLRGENPPRPIPFHVPWPGAEGEPIPFA